MDLDAHIWLRGSEDCEVDAACRICDRGGEPVAWYTAGGMYPNPYDGVRVPSAPTIEAFVELARRHVREAHGG